MLSSMETTFVLDALEHALWARRPSGTIHHSDKGSQYVSLAYTQRLQEAELLASTGGLTAPSLHRLKRRAPPLKCYERRLYQRSLYIHTADT
uniref:Transposase n=1 Tax=Escherichia coli TaxID=562 RepID=A0A0E3H164_ECOLX|nr:transposase [Escherichia coli]